MKKLKVLSIVGTRPEVIKLAPIIMEFERRPQEFISKICATGQHRELLDQTLESFTIAVDYDLRIMSVNQNLAQITSRVVEGIDGVLSRVEPDLVLVQGDTTTAFCGALASFYRLRKVAHIEAGLRTANKYAPFPEEINRRLLTQLADYHFAPTEHAKAQLIAEGISPTSIFVTGNTVIDALLDMRERVRLHPPELSDELARRIANRPLILVTGHRRESFGEGFENICQAIRQVADAFPEVAFVYPVHLNPNVREPVNRILGNHNRIYLIEPVSYPRFVWLMEQATIILTDSGGVQEEAPSLGKPVLVMRETTERPEGIHAGNARLVGVQAGKIVEELSHLLVHPESRQSMAKVRNPYGDGQAAKRIVNTILQIL